MANQSFRALWHPFRYCIRLSIDQPFYKKCRLHDIRQRHRSSDTILATSRNRNCPQVLQIYCPHRYSARHCRHLPVSAILTARPEWAIHGIKQLRSHVGYLSRCRNAAIRLQYRINGRNGQLFAFIRIGRTMPHRFRHCTPPEAASAAGPRTMLLGLADRAAFAHPGCGAGQHKGSGTTGLDQQK